MGEIAEMMLDGTCCQVCGEWLGGDGYGFPVTCPGCGGDDADDDTSWHRSRFEVEPKKPKTHQCKTCRRYFRGEQGLRDHQRTTGHEGRGNVISPATHQETEE